MTFPLLIVGLIFELAGKGWFSGAGTVGWILIVIGAIGIALQLLILGLVAKSISAPPAAPRRRFR